MVFGYVTCDVSVQTQGEPQFIYVLKTDNDLCDSPPFKRFNDTNQVKSSITVLNDTEYLSNCKKTHAF